VRERRRFRRALCVATETRGVRVACRLDVERGRTECARPRKENKTRKVGWKFLQMSSEEEGFSTEF
jgi:hypothetical protein